MRKILITLVILIACIAALSATWIFRGRQLSLFIDRFGTIETASARINSIVYEGSGTGGILHINDLALGLNDKNGPTPNIGTTKDNQLGLATGGKVFAFGPPRSEAENLATVPPAGDDAFIRIRRSALSWPTPFDFNFMTGHSPSWKRHRYYQLVILLSRRRLGKRFHDSRRFYRSDRGRYPSLSRIVNELVCRAVRCIISRCSFRANSKSCFPSTR